MMTISVIQADIEQPLPSPTCGRIANSQSLFRAAVVLSSASCALEAISCSRKMGKAGKTTGMLDAIASHSVIGLVSLVVGTMIGATSIGGVLLAPGLNIVGHTSIRDAIPICMLAFAFSGFFSTIIYARRKVIQWASLGFLSLGACPSAFAGASIVGLVPVPALKLAIAVLVVVAGVQAVFGRRENQDERHIGSGSLIAVGAIVGFGSSLTGTGGPLILLPLLMLVSANLLQSIGLAQAIQIPIGLFASANNLIYGGIDLTLAPWVTALVVVGVCLGTTFVRHHSPAKIRPHIGFVLTTIGLFYGVNALASAT